MSVKSALAVVVSLFSGQALRTRICGKRGKDVTSSACRLSSASFGETLRWLAVRDFGNGAYCQHHVAQGRW